MISPIIIFTYNRYDHTRRTVEALLKNSLASQSDLIIYSDAARTQIDSQNVDSVRDYLQTISGFLSIKVIHRPHNFGLAKSIIEGVTEVLQQFETVIVLEDDMVSSPHFLSYMNEALDKYNNDDRVISIHGYVYPVEQALPEAFFLPGADCWGWATWKRGWALFNPDGQYLLDELGRRKMLKSFDFNGSYPYSSMLKGQIKGMNDSWAVRWYASAFLANKLTLYPGRSLVHNIGNDNSGTHCSESDILDATLSELPINLNHIEVAPSQEGMQAFENFFRKTKQGILKRLFNKARTLLRRTT